MFALVYVTLLGWPLFTVLLFKKLPHQWAVVISYVGAYLFLPQFNIPLPGPFDYGKMAAASYGVLLSTLLFDVDRLRSFQPSWLDLPIFTYCIICPFITAVTNDLTLYDGFSDAVNQGTLWGGPYFLGRLYLSSLEGLRKLAIGILIGGLLYVPLCMYESRMSPQLHNMVYGFHSLRQFMQSYRWGGYRPNVFLKHGLSVGVWMMATTLISFVFWRTKVVTKVMNIPMKWIFLILLVNIVLVRSTGAWLLLGLSIVVFITIQRLRTHILALVISLMLMTYFVVSGLGYFNGDGVVNFFAETISEERAQSLEFRFDNEVLLSGRARERMIWGWGGYGRNRVRDGWGEDITTVDSWWVITFGTYGLVGLFSLALAMFLPAIIFLRMYPGQFWTIKKIAPAGTLVIVVVMYMFDNALNNQFQPVFVLAAGAIQGLVIIHLQNNSRVGVNLTTAQNYLSLASKNHGSQ
ncbi:MAG: hypothetical protein VKK04_22780 [Synechococcales bacterium]|nr:hypothetical protein [Synechococcales bacterium]